MCRIIKRLPLPARSRPGLHLLHAVERGRRRKRRPVVCVPGYDGQAADFEPLTRSLACDTLVICPELPPPDGGAWLAAPFDGAFAHWLADVRTGLDQLGVGEVDWVGHSTGALLGLMLASQPDTPVARLVMHGVGAYVPPESLRQVAGNRPAPDAMVTGLHFWSAWYRVRCPVLLVREEGSQAFPASVAATMRDIRPGTALVESRGAASAAMTAEEVAAVRAFIEAEPGSMAAVCRGARHEPRALLHPPGTA